MDWLFYVMLAFFATHEIDAVWHKEWRLLFILRKMDDKTAFQWFTLLHVPIFFVFFLLLDVEWFQIAVDSFALIHAGLHWRLRSHPKYSFAGALSNGLIGGAAFFGLLHLVTLLVR